MNEDNLKTQFLYKEFFTLSINGAFQHNKIYKESISEEEKKEFKEYLYKKIINISKKYKTKKISNNEHVNNLEKLQKEIENNKKLKNILNNEKITFGTCQKLLNLYLKYLWCNNEINTPPHCPLDSIILKELKIYRPFTKMNKAEYEKYIQLAKNTSNGKIAEWELKEWNRNITKN